MQLLSRDDFRKAVFERDGYKCVVCGQPAKDAHHIIERRLWPNGGYYLANGASLCSACHILAEQTNISTSQIREKAGIEITILPPHLYPDYEYDKWGNIENANGSRYKGELFFDESVQKILAQGDVLRLFLPYIKYPRTFHLPCSLGRTKDDRAHADYSCFVGKEVVVTIKMDGENTSAYADGHIHARSIDSDNHPSRNWCKNYLSSKIHDLPPNWRLCGENLYAKHSIHYKELKSYFYLFSIWDERNTCLSWDDTLEWAALLGLTTVHTMYRGKFELDIINTLAAQVEMQQDRIEGFVLRLSSAFSYQSFQTSVGKYVRKNHVQTNQHWMRTSVVKNELDPLLKNI